MLKEKIKAALKESMKARDQIALDTVRILLTAMQYEEIQKGLDSLSDDAYVAIFQSEIKKRREEIEFAAKSGRPELVGRLEKEIGVVERFLPTQLSEQELEKIVSNYKNESATVSVGQIMKLLKEQFAGQYDGKKASEVAQRILSA